MWWSPAIVWLVSLSLLRVELLRLEVARSIWMVHRQGHIKTHRSCVVNICDCLVVGVLFGKPVDPEVGNVSDGV